MSANGGGAARRLRRRRRRRRLFFVVAARARLGGAHARRLEPRLALALKQLAVRLVGRVAARPEALDGAQLLDLGRDGERDAALVRVQLREVARRLRVEEGRRGHLAARRDARAAAAAAAVIVVGHGRVRRR